LAYCNAQIKKKEIIGETITFRKKILCYSMHKIEKNAKYCSLG